MQFEMAANQQSLYSRVAAKIALRSQSTLLRLRAQRPINILLKNLVQFVLECCGYQLRRVTLPREEKFNIPDRDLYRPLYSPWMGEGEFRRYFNIVSPRSLVAADACHTLYSLMRQAMHIPGDIWECGVYKGGTSAMLANMLQDAGSQKKLYMFDTFAGIQQPGDSIDSHGCGDFGDACLDSVLEYINCGSVCMARPGLIPQSFVGLESAKIAMAHIDVVLYKSTLDCIEFIWPRLSQGGFIVFDDYGFGSCPGARAAVDKFFSGNNCVPICLPTGQAIVFKS